MKFMTFNRNISKQSIKLFLLIVLSLIIYILFLNFINYKCIFHEYLGIWCAGCGGTRMLLSFVHLDFYQAFRWNPLLFIFLIMGIIYLIVGIIVFIKKKVIMIPTLKLCIVLIGILIIYMILRNIDIFSYLVPTRIS